MDSRNKRSEQAPISIRRVGRPFPPGVSGNPGGRPRGLVSAIRSETQDGAELVRFMLSVLRAEVPGATLRDRMAAASWLADHGFGRPLLTDPAGAVVQVQPTLVVQALAKVSDAALDELSKALAVLPPAP